MKKQQPRWIELALEALLLIAGSGIYYWLVMGSHPGMDDFMSWLVDEKAMVLFGLIFFYIVSYQLPGWLGRSIRWIGLIALCGAFLRGYWIIKRTAFFQVYGILPFVDASEYFFNAQRLLLGYAAQGTTIGRPFFTSFFTGIYWGSGYNLQISLSILVGLVGLSIHILQESTRKHFGVIPAAIMASFSFMFYRNYLGAISSESLGLILGCLGWAVLFECFIQVRLKYLFGGLFLLTMALVTRAGPFLVLPFILLAFLVIFVTKKERISQIAVSGVAIVSGFLINSGVLKILSHNQSYLFPNYLYSLYGIAAGGKGWGYIKEVRPDLMAMQEPERTNQIYTATLNLIKAEPLAFIWNMLKQYWYFVLYGNTSLFSYLFTNLDWFNILMMVVLYGLCIFTIILQIRNWKNLKSLVILGIVVGIVLSVPFVPPQDESNMRAFAVTVPIMALIPAISLKWIIDRIMARIQIKMGFESPSSSAGSGVYRGLTIGVTLLVLLTSISPALFLNRMEYRDVPASADCLPGETAFVWKNNPTNNVWVAKNVNPSAVNEIQNQRLQKLHHDISESDEIPLFQSFHTNITISEQVNYLDGTSAWLIIPNDPGLNEMGIYAGCGVFTKFTPQYLFDYMEITRATRLSNE